MDSGTLFTRRADDLRDLAQWWWDEAVRFADVGARGLNEFAIRQAIKFSALAEEARRV